MQGAEHVRKAWGPEVSPRAWARGEDAAEVGSATTGLRRLLADRGCKGSRTLALLRSTQRNVATLDGRGYLPGVEGELGVGSLSLPSDTCRYLR